MRCSALRGVHAVAAPPLQLLRLWSPLQSQPAVQPVLLLPVLQLWRQLVPWLLLLALPWAWPHPALT